MSLTAASQITLPPARHAGGIPLFDVLAMRHSAREFDSSRELSPEEISTLLWAAVGINRPDEGRLTSPTALNAQEISVYLLTQNASYLYNSRENTLEQVSVGDSREYLTSRAGDPHVQDFVMQAPACFVFVADLSKFSNLPREAAIAMANTDAGIACENLTLAVTSLELATVPRATMNIEALRNTLRLTPDQIPVLNSPVGHPAKPAR